MPSQTQKFDTWADIPAYLQPAIVGPKGTVPQYEQFQQSAPSLSQLPGLAPELTVPGLTPDQQAAINATLSYGMASPDLAAARDQLQALTSGPVGSSPATAAGMKAFQDLVAPQIAQQQALAGRATGGAATEALAQGAEQAAVPLIQQEIQNRAGAVGQYGQLAQQQIASLQASLEAAGVPREIAQEQAMAAYEQQQQKYGLETQLQTFPLQLMSQLIGQGGISKSYGTMDALDWVGAIGGAGNELLKTIKP